MFWENMFRKIAGKSPNILYCHVVGPTEEYVSWLKSKCIRFVKGEPTSSKNVLAVIPLDANNTEKCYVQQLYFDVTKNHKWWIPTCGWPIPWTGLAPIAYAEWPEFDKEMLE